MSNEPIDHTLKEYALKSIIYKIIYSETIKEKFRMPYAIKRTLKLIDYFLSPDKYFPPSLGWHLIQN